MASNERSGAERERAERGGGEHRPLVSARSAAVSLSALLDPLFSYLFLSLFFFLPAGPRYRAAGDAMN